MQRIKYLFAACIICLSATIHAQVNGRVTDTSNIPLDDCRIQLLSDPKKTSNTDPQGRFSVAVRDRQHALGRGKPPHLAGPASLTDTIRIDCDKMAPAYISLTEDAQNVGTVQVRPPNVIVILLDDAGYGDFSMHGKTAWQTPHIDRLAREGALFENFYVAQGACSASRASLLTGTYSARFQFPWVLSPGVSQGLPEQEKTIAELVKEQGYATALFGKWHLGNTVGAWPLRHGFDEFFGIPRSGGYNGVSLLEGNAVVNSYKGQSIKTNIGKNGSYLEGIPQYNDPAAQEMLTTWFTERSVDFIQRKKASPFFLYVAYNQPHVGLFVSDAFKGKSGAGLYGDVMMEIDHSIGEILKALKNNGIDRQTLVFFSSDNGPWEAYGNHAGSVGPFKTGYGKRNTHEGGVHEPGIAWWPGKIPAGTTIETPVMTIDILPTVAALMDGILPDHKIDGVDISALLLGENTTLPERHLYFYKGNQLQSVRYKNWKYHFNYSASVADVIRNDGAAGTYKDVDQPEALYDLSKDLTESNNLISSNRAVANTIRSTATTFNSQLQDTNQEGRPIQHY